jgi:glucose-6-phosphate 1-dehydrogenase
MKSTPRRRKAKPKLKIQKAKDNFTLFIFGASGSLAKLKLYPAIYELVRENRTPKDFKIVGYARTPMTNKEFRDFFAAAIRKAEKHVDEKALKKLLKNVHYFTGQYDDQADYKRFLRELRSIEKEKNRVRIAYFSVPPSAFDPILKNLGSVNFNTVKGKLRLVVEKPFGYNLGSAKRLRKSLIKHFDRDQIYLLDHYLGKEAVSNLLSLRYANSVLTTLMHRKYVSNIQITAMEDKDIEGRSNYFDNVGILRDMVQSHLLQILAFLTMYAPQEQRTKAVAHEKAKILSSVKITNPKKHVVRGQYQGYTKEKGIPADSQTETYAALKMELNHPLWKGVPIYMRSGKSLKQKWTSVVIEFKPRASQRRHGDLPPNRLVIQLQPFEKIEFFLLTKLGGKTFKFHDLTTGRPIYCSGDCLTEHGRLLLDVISGQQRFFLNFEEIFAAWKVIDPLQKVCNKMRKKHCSLHTYKKGSLGPAAANKLIEADGFEWFYSLPNA